MQRNGNLPLLLRPYHLRTVPLRCWRLRDFMYGRYASHRLRPTLHLCRRYLRPATPGRPLHDGQSMWGRQRGLFEWCLLPDGDVPWADVFRGRVHIDSGKLLRRWRKLLNTRSHDLRWLPDLRRQHGLPQPRRRRSPRSGEHLHGGTALRKHRNLQWHERLHASGPDRLMWCPGQLHRQQPETS
jgi:hypothetical protein